MGSPPKSIPVPYPSNQEKGGEDERVSDLEAPFNKGVHFISASYMDPNVREGSDK